ncbi:MAG: all-trans-retinol 13,14-reductase [Chlamydiales bacterium]|jgi:all-trans-retinol 13,14-reductase
MNASREYLSGSRAGKAPLKSSPLEGARSRYDAIVIGSGLAGLTAANILGRAGHKVAILEQHYNCGGMATWFKRRGGHTFDVSLHGFPFGMKKTCRKYWNKTIADSIVQLGGVRFDNPQFTFDTTFDRVDFSNKLVEVFGIERSKVEAFFDHVRAMDFYDDDGRSTAELFEEFFPGRNDVHRLLMEPIAYANGSSLADPAISYGIVFSNFMSKGVYTFTGGTDLLIREMKAELKRQGVELFNRVQVDRIVVEGGRTRGVEACGRFLEADVVISNANLKVTLEKLVGLEHFDADFAGGARDVRLNSSSCQVYMGIRAGETLAMPTDLLFTSTRPTFHSPSLCEMHGESRTFSFYGPQTRPGSDRFTVVSSTNALYKDWASLSEAEYESNKARLIEEALESLEHYVPGTRAKIDHVEAATPRTFEFYTQHHAGSSFGTKFEGLKYSMELSKQIDGLYHAGSVGIIMSGWLGAANYGAITAHRVDAFLSSLQEIVS